LIFIGDNFNWRKPVIALIYKKKSCFSFKLGNDVYILLFPKKQKTKTIKGNPKILCPLSQCIWLPTSQQVQDAAPPVYWHRGRGRHRSCSQNGAVCVSTKGLENIKS